MKTLLAIIFLSATMHAQTAKVIALTPKEAKIAKSLDDEQEELTVRKKAFDEVIRTKYLIAEKPRIDVFQALGKGGLTYFKEGWTFGEFEFSEDWKYIVPKANTTLSTPLWSGTGSYCAPLIAN